MLSRLEGDGTLTLQRVDLAAITRQAVAALAPAALDKAQRIELDAPAPCWVSGDEALLGALVRNLVDNAIRYSPREAAVHVRVDVQGAAVMLAVHDSGPGLAELDRERLGQRFFRVLGTDASGSGLGWSIVQRIAATHGATVAVGRSAAWGGLSVQLGFPATA